MNLPPQLRSPAVDPSHSLRFDPEEKWLKRILMLLKVDASFENGVFVPAQLPALADRERVRLTIEAAATSREKSAGSIQGSHPDDQGSRIGNQLAIALDFHPDGC
jgi:hypothetical protein